jgi:hypothetical protein
MDLPPGPGPLDISVAGQDQPEPPPPAKEERQPERTATEQPAVTQAPPAEPQAPPPEPTRLPHLGLYTEPEFADGDEDEASHEAVADLRARRLERIRGGLPEGDQPPPVDISTEPTSPAPQAEAKPDAPEVKPEGKEATEEEESDEDTIPPEDRLPDEEEAEILMHEQGVEKGEKDALYHIDWLRRHPKAWKRKPYGSWERYCWVRFRHSKTWALYMVRRAEYQALLEKEAPGQDIRVGQLDQKEMARLEEWPDLQARALVKTEQHRLEQGSKRKSATYFKKVCKDFARYAPLRGIHSDLAGEEIESLVLLRAEDNAHLDARFLKFAAAEKDINVSGLLVGDADGTASVLATYRGERLKTLAEQLAPIWPEFEQAQKKAEEERKKAEEEQERQRQEAAKNPRPNENGHEKKDGAISGAGWSGVPAKDKPEDKAEPQEDQRGPRFYMSVTAQGWAYEPMREALVNGDCEVYLVAKGRVEGEEEGRKWKKIGDMVVTNWKAKVMEEGQAEEG